MARKIAIIAALRREVRGLVGSARPDAKMKSDGVWRYELPGAVVVAAGMGAMRAALAVGEAMQGNEIAALWSVGLAGSCSPECKAGGVRDASIVVDVNTGERYTTGDRGGVVLATGSAVASVAEKKRLHDAYGAALVDMEAATVARLARAHGLPFRAIKAVSDAHDFELESMNGFADARGNFRTAAFALHTALRPATWGATMTLGRNSARALEAMTARLCELLATHSLS